MQELIKITKQVFDDQEVNAVNARELHQFLGIKRDFTNWVKDQIQRANLIQNIDFTIFAKKGENPSAGRPAMEYIVALDAAKHIAMMAGTKAGFQVRQYFIEFEKAMRKKQEEYKDDPVLKMLESVRIMRSEQLALRQDVDGILAIQKQAETNLADTPRSEIAPPDKTTRSKLNQLIRSYVHKNTLPFDLVWQNLYKEFTYTYHIDIVQRAQNQNLKTLEFAEKEGFIDQLYDLASKLY